MQANLSTVRFEKSGGKWRCYAIIGAGDEEHFIGYYSSQKKALKDLITAEFTYQEVLGKLDIVRVARSNLS